MKSIEFLELHALHGIAMTSVFHINSIIFLNNGMIFGRALVFSCVVSKLLLHTRTQSYFWMIVGQAGLEAAFQVPMPGDSCLSPNAQ